MDFPELAATFPGPTLFLTGAASDYVRPEHWPRIRALFPAAEHRADRRRRPLAARRRAAARSSRRSRRFLDADD